MKSNPGLIDPVLKVITWSRDEEIDRPNKYKDFSVHYVHGHTGEESVENPNSHILNLNGFLGMYNRYNTGTYSVVKNLNYVNKIFQNIDEETLKKIDEEYLKLFQEENYQQTFNRNVATLILNKLSEEKFDKPLLHQFSLFVLNQNKEFTNLMLYIRQFTSETQFYS